jgi:hypothetical protein
MVCSPNWRTSDRLMNLAYAARRARALFRDLRNRTGTASSQPRLQGDDLEPLAVGWRELLY